jgi:hypothetical protein
MKTLRVWLTAFSLLAMAPGAWAQADSPANFFDQWAVGLAFIHPKVSSVTDATIVNGVVRVNGKAANEASLLVARHFYPWNPGRRCLEGGSMAAAEKAAKPSFLDSASGFLSNCVGAMVGVGLGTSGGSGSGQLINFAGFGLTIGGGIPKDDKSSWNVGIGVGRKFNVKTLGDGFTENQAPPPGETQVRYKTLDASARFAYFTVHW